MNKTVTNMFAKLEDSLALGYFEESEKDPEQLQRQIQQKIAEALDENGRVRDPNEKKVDKKRAQQIYQRMMEAEEKRGEKIKKMQIDKLLEENDNHHVRRSSGLRKSTVMTNQPNDRSKTPRMSKSPLRSMKNFHNRVEEQQREKAERLSFLKIEEAQQREEQMKEECTFKPKINKSHKNLLSQKPSVCDIDIWKKKCQQRIIGEQMTERPSIQPRPTSPMPRSEKTTRGLAKSKTPSGRVLQERKDLNNDFDNRAECSKSPALSSRSVMKRSVSRSGAISSRAHKNTKSKAGIMNQNSTDISRTVISVDELFKAGNKKPQLSKGPSIPALSLSSPPNKENLPLSNLPPTQRAEKLKETKADPGALLTPSPASFDDSSLQNSFNRLITCQRSLQDCVDALKLKTSRDGREYIIMSDGSKVYFNHDVVTDVINVGMRKKVALGE